MELLPQLIVGVSVSAAASLLGVFAILKRMSLVGDALSHVALPGIALAIFLNINPFFGGLTFLLLSIAAIWLIEYYSHLTVDAIVGVLFTASLAAGALLIPRFDLLEALFGDISKLTFNEMAISVFLSLSLIVILLAIHKKLALHMVSQELAKSIGVNSKKLEFVYLILFAVGVALGIKFIGALLMGALIIVPAAAGKNVARSLRGFMGWSVFFGILSAIAGVYISAIYGYAPGPIFILAGAVLFAVSMILRVLFRRDYRS